MLGEARALAARITVLFFQVAEGTDHGNQTLAIFLADFRIQRAAAERLGQQLRHIAARIVDHLARFNRFAAEDRFVVQ